MGRNAELQAGIDGARGVQLDMEPVTAHVAAQYHNKHGGSSFYVHGGARATEGYAVGGLEGAPETTIDRPTITPEEYQAHRDRVRASVKDENAIAGSWVEDGKSVMDASNAVLSRDQAKALQIKRGERKVFNLSSGEEEDLR
jgi:hypothetical protein